MDVVAAACDPKAGKDGVMSCLMENMARQAFINIEDVFRLVLFIKKNIGCQFSHYVINQKAFILEVIF